MGADIKRLPNEGEGYRDISEYTLHSVHIIQRHLFNCNILGLDNL